VACVNCPGLGQGVVFAIVIRPRQSRGENEPHAIAQQGHNARASSRQKVGRKKCGIADQQNGKQIKVLKPDKGLPTSKKRQIFAPACKLFRLIDGPRGPDNHPNQPNRAYHLTGKEPEQNVFQRIGIAQPKGQQRTRHR